ncbi:MAG: glycosyltransferase family 2 protein [Rikenellaceae bacterium]|nr:glycosyltransferase family 2 protein [Rikenellaceae bacterium]
MNKTKEYELTVVVPVYNEVESLPRVERAMREWLPTSPVKACVLMVNDGSKDGSLELMREICARNEAMFYISLAKNGGLSVAMKAGIDATHSRYVGYIDADLQTTPEDFNLLLEHVADYQLVMGIRAGRKDSFFKNLQSKIANGFRNMMTHDGAKDTGCPLKVMWSDYAKRIPFFTGMHRFLPALIQLQEGRMMQIPVRHFPRTEGVSKYHLWNRLVGPFKDCFAYRWMRKRYINYQIGEGNV